MAKITMDELSDSLKEQLSNLISGNESITPEQVMEIVNNVSGNLEELQTKNKTSIVGAINELFQNANNGKQVIADAIGEPVSADDTFNAMSNDIELLLGTFKANMLNKGISVENSDKFKNLIDKIPLIVGLPPEEGEGGETIDPFLLYRNALASVLEDEGVEVLETDDLAILISKADIALGDQVVPVGTAFANDVLEGKTFINETGSVIEGTMANIGELIITPTTKDQKLDTGYYKDTVVKGDSDLVPGNIAEGIDIFGVTGTVKRAASGSGKWPTTGKFVAYTDFVPDIAIGCGYYGACIVYHCHFKLSSIDAYMWIVLDLAKDINTIVLMNGPIINGGTITFPSYLPDESINTDFNWICAKF